MKKILGIILSVLMCLSFASFAACDNNSSSGKGEESIVILNGYNCYDDIATTYLSDTHFFGYFTRNKDDSYIVEGDASYKVELIKFHHSNTLPEFKTKAAGLKKTSIIDVVEFGLYIYSELENEFTIMLNCLNSNGAKIYSKAATVYPGDNNLIFPVNRAVIQDTGTAVQDYSFTFSEINELPAVFYFDNFYAKVTTAEVEVNPEVTSLVNDIINTSSGERSKLESLLARYKALSIEDRQAVYNFKMLQSMMQTYWLQDLSAAQAYEPNKLLFFDRPFGEGQVESTTDAIASFEYSTAVKHGSDVGSMRFDFGESATPWNTINTAAEVNIDESKFVEFYVYNDSDQLKGFKVDWEYPATGYITLNQREWTRIVAPVTNLTNRGYLLVVGLTEGHSARVPEGTIYISSVVVRDYTQEILDARTGSDKNTVFFFDRDLGLEQVAQTKGGNIDDNQMSISTTVKPQGHAATLKLDTNVLGTTSYTPVCLYDTVKYEFTSGSYVMFQAYIEYSQALKTDKTENPADSSKYIDFRFTNSGNSCGTRVYAGQWTTILVPSSALTAGSFYFYSGFRFEGSIYLTKGVEILASQVKDISAKSGDNYTLGEENFVGYKYANTSNGTEFTYTPVGGLATGAILWTPNDAIFNQPYDIAPYYVNGIVRFTMRADQIAVNKLSSNNIVLQLQNKATFTAGSTFSFTMRGIKATSVAVRNSSDATVTPASVPVVAVETLSDGYVRYEIPADSIAELAGTSYDLIVIYVEALWSGTSITYGDISSFSIN